MSIETTAGPGYAPFRIERALVGRAIELLGLTLVVAGSFGPWLRSGDRLRTSYELFHVADRLGFLGHRPLAWLPTAWVFVPLFAAVAVALHVATRHRLATALAALVGASALVVGAGVLVAPLPTGWGCWLGAAGGMICLVGTVTSTSPHRRSNPHDP